MLPGFTAAGLPAFCLLPIFNINPINFYPVKYFVEISEADLAGTINLVNLELRTQNPEPCLPCVARRAKKGTQNLEPRTQKKEEYTMNRRQFIKRSTMSCAAVALLPGHLPAQAKKTAAPASSGASGTGKVPDYAKDMLLHSDMEGSIGARVKF